MTKQSHRLRLVGLLVVAGVLLLFYTAHHFQYNTFVSCNSPYANVYDVVIDAGSTGSRVHIFHFERTSSSVTLLSERFRRVEPGLSSYALYPNGVRPSLQGLLDLAREAVPPNFHACTAVTLKATAGLRLLPESQQAVLLEAATKTLAESPFQSRGVSIISGAQEGVYGWLTVNYLLGKLDGGATAVTIDMGGASTQVVFETDHAVGEWLPFNYARHLRIPMRSISLYQHSYLGLGLNEAKRTLLTAFATVNGTASFPCFPTGHTQQLHVIQLRNAAPADFDACSGLFRQHVVTKPTCKFDACGAHGIPQPAVPVSSLPVYAFSYFYDRLSRLVPEDAPVTVGTFREMGREACRRDSKEKPTSKETVCMDMAYLYTFLTQGLGLEDATPLTVPNRIVGKAVSWSLGSSLSYLLKME